MNSLIKIALCIILYQPIYAVINIYNHNQVYIVSHSFFSNIEKKNECGFNAQVCTNYFNEVISFLDDVQNGLLKKEKIYISALPVIDNKSTAPYNYIIEKNGYRYFLPKYIYNPDLLNSYDIIDKHQLSIGDVIVIYYLFDKVLFAELINEEN